MRSRLFPNCSICLLLRAVLSVFMGAQKKLLKRLVKKADYVLYLKDNHSSLHKDIVLFLSEIEKLHQAKPHNITDRHEEHDKGHGRMEHRVCYVTVHLDWL